MKFIKKIAFFSVLSFALAGCMAGGENANKTARDAVTSQYSVASLSVSVTDDVRVNELPRFTNEPKEKTVKTLKAYVNSAMKKTVAPAFVGKQPVNVETQITYVQMATSGGVILMQASSYMHGNVIVKDARTGELVTAERIVVEDRPFRGTGLAVIAAVAVNSGTTPEKRYTDLTSKFAQQALKALQ